ncbi:MAG: CHAT domain-containing protein [Saprospirales bacterium]|nr:CHAT domain-containing protein [Saprospirales bacterium]
MFAKGKICCFLLLAGLSLACPQSPPLPAQAQRADKGVLESDIVRLLGPNRSDRLLQSQEKNLYQALQSDDLALWFKTCLTVRQYFKGDPTKELACMDFALKHKWRHPNGRAEWLVFDKVQIIRGWRLFDLGRVWESVQALETAEAVYRRHALADSIPVVDQIYKLLGNNYTRLGDNEKALAVFQKALAVFQKALSTPQKNESLAGMYVNIAIACWNQGNLAESEENCRRGLALPNVSAEQRALLFGALARAQLDGGQAHAALPNALEALRLLRAPDPAARQYLLHIGNRARLHLLAADIFMQKRQFSQAEHALAEARADAAKAFSDAPHRDTDKIEVAFSRLNQLRGRPIAALEAANRALTRVIPSFRPGQPGDNPDPAAFYPENTIVEALESKAAVATDYFRQNQDARWLALALECHELAWRAEKRLRDVYLYQTSRLAAQEQARDREEAAMRIARMLYDKTGDRAYIEKGFAIAERSKASVLLRAVQENLIFQGPASGDMRLQELIGLKQNLAFLEPGLIAGPSDKAAAADSMRTRIAALERALFSKHASRIACLLEEPAPAGAPDPEETLVEYFVSDTAVEIFAWNKAGASAWRRLALTDTFYRQISAFQAFFAHAEAINQNPGGYAETAFYLFKSLIPKEVAGARRLLIIPDGFLCRLPFEALLTQAYPAGGSLRQVPYLLRSARVRYAWSLATLRCQDALQSHAEAYFLGVAPLFENAERGLAPLTACRGEWKNAGSRGIKALYGREANWAGVSAEAERRRVLHFCTHAVGDDHPRIELNDRPWLLPHIYSRMFQADLVVLSACETGAGDWRKGEGVMSLSRAFAQSGAACIVSSLWKANDQGAAQLFGNFYKNLRSGSRTAAALHQAKLDYLDDPKVGAAFQSPYFWACFTLLGSDRPVLPPAGLWGISAWALLAGGILLLALLFKSRFSNWISLAHLSAGRLRVFGF